MLTTALIQLQQHRPHRSCSYFPFFLLFSSLYICQHKGECSDWESIWSTPVNMQKKIITNCNHWLIFSILIVLHYVEGTLISAVLGENLEQWFTAGITIEDCLRNASFQSMKHVTCLCWKCLFASAHGKGWEQQTHKEQSCAWASKAECCWLNIATNTARGMNRRAHFTAYPSAHIKHVGLNTVPSHTHPSFFSPLKTVLRFLSL